MIAIFLLLIGVVLIVAGARGKSSELGAIVQDDFVSQPSYFVWILAVATIGIIGSFKPLKEASNAFYALLIIVLLLSNRGFFAEFNRQVFGP